MVFDDGAPARVFEPDSSPEGCATGECLPDEPTPAPAPAPVAAAPIPRPAPVAAPTQVAAAPVARPAPVAAPPQVAATPVARPAPVAPPVAVAPPPPVARPAAPPPAPPPASPRPAAGNRETEAWRTVIEAVRLKSPRHAKSLAFGRLVRLGGGEVVIAFPKDAEFHRATVSGGLGKQLIDEAVASQLGSGTRLVIDQNAAAEAAPSIAEQEAKERAAHERSVDSRVRNHPATQAAMRILGGELEHIQVLERDRPDVPEPELTDENV